jgi:hypothetical protein
MTDQPLTEKQIKLLAAPRSDMTAFVRAWNAALDELMDKGWPVSKASDYLSEKLGEKTESETA